MPTLLSDPPFLLFGVIALAAIVPAVAAFLLPTDPRSRPKRQRTLLGASGFCILALVVLILLDRFFESDREQMIRKLNEMSAGVREGDMNRVFSHVSDSFRKGSHDKRSLRALAETSRRQGRVTEIKIWDEKMESFDPDSGKATFSFSFKVEGSAANNAPWRCKTHFRKESDGQWRLQDFDVFNPLVDQNTAIQIPGLQ